MSDREVLRRRAARLARREDVARERHLAFRVGVIAAGAQLIGIPVESLREIVVLPAPTPLPRCHPWLGIVQVRGDLVPVMDLHHVVDEKDPQHGVLAVVSTSCGLVGFAGRAVVDFRDVYADALAESLGARESNGAIRAVTRDLVSVLDVERAAIGAVHRIATRAE